MSDPKPHKEIWLQPWCQACNLFGGDRTWCKDNVWSEGCEECGAKPDHYVMTPVFNLIEHLSRQREWSIKTFGPGTRILGIIDHIRKELVEIEQNPHDISEWIDVIILALDGAWRAGYAPIEIVKALEAKQTRNEAREWPDWRTQSPDKAIEHVR